MVKVNDKEIAQELHRNELDSLDDPALSLKKCVDDSCGNYDCLFHRDYDHDRSNGNTQRPCEYYISRERGMWEWYLPPPSRSDEFRVINLPTVKSS